MTAEFHPRPEARMTLDPKDLEVTSFETSEPAAYSLPTIDNPTDPTPATHCYWCPGDTYDCA
jgi:hypothetical protein